jgi:hypothetical protein
MSFLVRQKPNIWNHIDHSSYPPVHSKKLRRFSEFAENIANVCVVEFNVAVDITKMISHGGSPFSRREPWNSKCGLSARCFIGAILKRCYSFIHSDDPPTHTSR